MVDTLLLVFSFRLTFCFGCKAEKIASLLYLYLFEDSNKLKIEFRVTQKCDKDNCLVTITTIARQQFATRCEMILFLYTLMAKEILLHYISNYL